MTASELRSLWRGRREVALFDAREEGPFSEAHPFFAVPLPLSRIESRVFSLVPRRSAPIVVYDGGEGLAERAATRIAHLGYTNVSVLEGGLAGYADAGELFRDVNVPSKAFGELVESVRHTPSLTATDVKTLLDRKADVAVLDVRRFEEYRAMSIPSAVSVPGGELALRVFDLVPSPETLVVVNCAGRTRSIIGTQTLVNIGLPNRVAALRNGTIGWTLAGYSLDYGRSRRFDPTRFENRETARRAAADWAAHAGVPVIGPAQFDRWIWESEQRTLYRFDIRTPEEYVTGHPSGFTSAPGGQLVQATDEWAAVRGGRIVLFDDDGVRAKMTASWLMQMGWEVAVLEQGALEAPETGMPAPPVAPFPSPGPRLMTPAELAAELGQAVILDLAPSREYARGHIAGAWFILRSRFAEDIANIPAVLPLVLTSADGSLALWSAAELEAASNRPVQVLSGGTNAWTLDGRALECDRHYWASPAIDVYKRPYEGTDNSEAAMRAYIDWELQLVDQMERDGISNFRVIA
jgi:rhodanese-related sulfurtransferase